MFSHNLTENITEYFIFTCLSIHNGITICEIGTAGHTIFSVNLSDWPSHCNMNMLDWPSLNMKRGKIIYLHLFVCNTLLFCKKKLWEDKTVVAAICELFNPYDMNVLRN